MNPQAQRAHRAAWRLPARSILLAAWGSLAFSTAGLTAVLQMNGPHAIGVLHFAVGDQRYNLHFDSRSFSEILADPRYPDPFPFLTDTGFQDVEPVLNDLNTFLEAAGAERLRDPHLTDAVFGGIIPTRETSAARPAHFVGRANQFLGGDWRIPAGGGGAGWDRDDPASRQGYVFMVFTPVPEPAGITAVAAFALVGAAAVRRWLARRC
jgi:hypothetical protein